MTSASSVAVRRMQDVVRFAIGKEYAVLVTELRLTAYERHALVQMWAAHQAAMHEHAKRAPELGFETRSLLSRRKQRLDAAIRSLIGESRYSRFVKFREDLDGGALF